MAEQPEQAQQFCEHLSIKEMPEPNASKCEECGAAGPLRMCIDCGHVGCCESHQAHNTKHADAAGHPGIKSMPIGSNSWIWCYECQDYVA